MALGLAWARFSRHRSKNGFRQHQRKSRRHHGSIERHRKAQVDANVYGVLYGTHAALPLMRGRQGAMVSTVSSAAGRYGFADWSVYSATKFAVIGFHGAMRKEFGAEGIRFSLIDPGSVWSEWGHKTPDGMMQKRREAVDAMLPEDIATALIYSFAQPNRVLVEEMVIRPVRQLAP